jgi:hypothetical protein
MSSYDPINDKTSVRSHYATVADLAIERLRSLTEARDAAPEEFDARHDRAIAAMAELRDAADAWARG